MADREITICTQDGTPENREIKVCTQDGTPENREIKVCDRENENEDNCSGTLPALTISGTQTPIVGSSFSGGGGVPPYTFSFDGGSISSSGQITAINDCSVSDAARWATVTVSDACEQSASVEVRLPGGYWMELYSEGPLSTFPGDCAAVSDGSCQAVESGANCMSTYGFSSANGQRQSTPSGRAMYIEHGRWRNIWRETVTFSYYVYPDCSCKITTGSATSESGDLYMLSDTEYTRYVYTSNYIDNGSKCEGSTFCEYCVAYKNQIGVQRVTHYEWRCV